MKLLYVDTSALFKRYVQEYVASDTTASDKAVAGYLLDGPRWAIADSKHRGFCGVFELLS